MLQFITDHPTMDGTFSQALAALDGGCRWIQVRMKNASADEVEMTVRKLLPHCKTAGALLIIDDHVDVAAATEADGVHLGKNDMPPTEARAILGNGKIIGATANSIEDIMKLPLETIDYLGVGPYRFTMTKKNLSPLLGLEGYSVLMERLRSLSDIPVVAIGGIEEADIPGLMTTGISGVAVSGVVTRSQNPAETIRQIIEILNNKP